jgi:hypothetical protein
VATQAKRIRLWTLGSRRVRIPLPLMLMAGPRRLPATTRWHKRGRSRRSRANGTQPRTDDSTREAECSEAEKSHTADRSPTSKGDAPTQLDRAKSDADDRENAAEHFQEMTELGAQVKGEGEIK